MQIRSHIISTKFIKLSNRDKLKMVDQTGSGGFMLKKFVDDTSGAVTIDWVALTAGILLLGMTLVYAIFNNGVGDLAKSINSAMSAVDPAIDTGDRPGQSSFQ